MLLDEQYIDYINIILRGKDWHQLSTIFDSLNLNLEEKIDFCLYVILNDNINFSSTITFEFVPFIFNNLLIDNLLQSSNFIIDFRLNEIIKCFKDYNLIANVILQNEYVINKLVNEEKFREEILEDTDLLINYQNSYNLFNNLPIEYRHLISLYNLKNDKDLSINNLYGKYYSNDFSKIELEELINIQMQINNESDMFELGLKYRIKEFTYFLYKINDKNYYDKIKKLSINSNIDLLKIIRFSIKYDNTNLLFNIINLDNFDNDLKEKIIYLSNSDKLIQDINILDISIEELKKLPKEHNYNIKINFVGGPHSNTFTHLFNDGVNREIIRINYDGTIMKYVMSNLGNHEDGVKRI